MFLDLKSKIVPKYLFQRDADDSTALSKKCTKLDYFLFCCLCYFHSSLSLRHIVLLSSDSWGDKWSCLASKLVNNDRN